ncbi:hypothetical protein ABK040_009255 [Willaertia magna]
MSQITQPIAKQIDWVNDELRNVKPLTLILATASTLLATYYGKELIKASRDHPNGLKGVVLGSLLARVRQLPGLKNKVEEEQAKTIKDIKKSLQQGLENEKLNLELPQEGIPYNELIQVLKRFKELDMKKVNEKKLSGVIYMDNVEQNVDNNNGVSTEEDSKDPFGWRSTHEELLAKTFRMFMHSNPLHADCFLATRKMESEIIRMTAQLMHGDYNIETGEGVVGATTSGGTDSILMAVKAYRDQARKEKPWIKVPEIILPKTAHCAFEKACHYLGVKHHYIDIDNVTLQVNVDLVEKAINHNTILIVGSAPNYPHGIIDPISELSKIALKHNVGLHVDSCLGGFVVPFAKKLGLDIGVEEFDFTLPGVTSMSVDTHKYGLAPKGSSVLLFRNRDLRKYMYFVAGDWTGGIYGTVGIPGSRSGSLLATTWASLMHVGEKGFLTNAKQIVTAVSTIKERIRKEIPELVVMGDPKTVVVAFQTAPNVNMDIFKVMDAMAHKGWALNALQFPSALHICLTLNTSTEEKVNNFINDLKEAVKEAKNDPNGITGNAPVYGMAASIPDRSVVEDIFVKLLDSFLDV